MIDFLLFSFNPRELRILTIMLWNIANNITLRQENLILSALAKDPSLIIKLRSNMTRI